MVEDYESRTICKYVCYYLFTNGFRFDEPRHGQACD
jgi:hypothetical protein